MTKSAESRHRRNVHKIITNARELFGLEHILFSCEEPTIRAMDGHQLKCGDILIGYSQTGDDMNCLLADYKASLTYRNKAIQQLASMESFIRQFYNPQEVQKYLVWSDELKTERLQ